MSSCLARYRNRSRSTPDEFEGSGSRAEKFGLPAAAQAPIASPPALAAPVESPVKLNRAASAALMKKLSPRELSEFFLASRDRRTAMSFDDGTALTPEERGQVLEILGRISRETPASSPASPRHSQGTAPVSYAHPEKCPRWRQQGFARLCFRGLRRRVVRNCSARFFGRWRRVRFGGLSHGSRSTSRSRRSVRAHGHAPIECHPIGSLTHAPSHAALHSE
jgi:hypothetical protein